MKKGLINHRVQMIRFFFMAVFAIGSVGSFEAAGQDNAMVLLDTSYMNVAYANTSDTLQKMDVFLVKNRNHHTPLVVLIHGGGWIGGRKEDVMNFTTLFVNKGFNVVAINYRLTTLEANSPRCKDIIADVNSAVQYTSSHSKEWNIRNKNYVLWGGSAGAHLALLYAYQFDKKSIVSAAVGFGTPAKLNDTCWNNIPNYRQVAEAALGRFLGIKWVGDTADPKAIKASPYFSTKFKPTMMIHGEKDSVVPRSQAELMYNLLQQNKVDSKYILLKNGGHVGEGSTKEEIVAAMEASVDWIKKYSFD